MSDWGRGRVCQKWTYADKGKGVKSGTLVDGPCVPVGVGDTLNMKFVYLYDLGLGIDN